MEQELAMQKLRAVILSDGGLYPGGRSACFRIDLSDNRKDLVQRELIPIKELLEFLQRFVVEVLEPLGVEPCSGHPKIKSHATKSKEGEWLPGVVLYTRNSGLLTKLRREYYPGGKKAIPANFALTSVSLAWFFMLDGCSAWSSHGSPGISVYLYTQGLGLSSIEVFEEQLHSLEVNTGRAHRKVKDGSGIMITVLQDSVDHFMYMIDPFVILPYRYKVKYRASCPPGLAKKYKGLSGGKVGK